MNATSTHRTADSDYAQTLFEAACYMEHQRETRTDSEAAYRAHRAYVNLAADYAQETGISTEEAARRVTEANSR